ncbi:MAG: rod shape-determining protein MreC [Terriglobia bacterium]
MLEVNSPETPQPGSPRTPQASELMHAFVSRHIPFFILVAVLLVQLVFLAFQVTRKHNVRLIKLWAVAAFDPFERSVRGLTDVTGTAIHTYDSAGQMQSENSNLRQQLAAAHAEILQLSEARVENAHLKSLLGLSRQLPLHSVAATVIATSPGTSSAVFIDKGTDDGLATDLPVITPEGVVGKTVAVFPHTAQVLLITDRASGVGGMIEKTQAEGVLKGDGDDLCRFAYIMNQETVATGDMVVTSGLDQIYPRGLLVGRVVKVSDGNIYKKITVKPEAALDRLEDVLVVLKPFTVSKAPSETDGRH